MAKALPNCKRRKFTNLFGRQTAMSHKPEGVLGSFDLLPFEVKILIFRKCRIQDLGMLTITSKAMQNVVLEFTEKDRIGRQMVQFHDLPHDKVTADSILTEKAHCYALVGTFMKRATCLNPTRDRLKIIVTYFKMMTCRKTVLCPKPGKCSGMTGFGIFLHTMIAGWDDGECRKVYSAVMTSACLLKPLESMLQVKQGTNIGLEYHLRIFFRRVFMEPCKSQTEKSFWITHLLKPCAIVNQARLLYLLFGAVDGGKILWQEMSDFGPSESDMITTALAEIGSVIKLLSCNTSCWSHDAIFSVLEELIYTPEEWLPENVATLLMNCGEDITTKVLISKTINGRIDDICSIIASICLVSGKMRRDQEYMLELINKAMYVLDKQKMRETFLHNLMDTFKDSIYDMHMAGDGDTLIFMTSVIDFLRVLTFQYFTMFYCKVNLHPEAQF